MEKNPFAEEEDTAPKEVLYLLASAILRAQPERVKQALANACGSYIELRRVGNVFLVLGRSSPSALVSLKDALQHLWTSGLLSNVQLVTRNGTIFPVYTDVTAIIGWGVWVTDTKTGALAVGIRPAFFNLADGLPIMHIPCWDVATLVALPLPQAPAPALSVPDLMDLVGDTAPPAEKAPGGVHLLAVLHMLTSFGATPRGREPVLKALGAAARGDTLWASLTTDVWYVTGTPHSVGLQLLFAKLLSLVVNGDALRVVCITRHGKAVPVDAAVTAVRLDEQWISAVDVPWGVPLANMTTGRLATTVQDVGETLPDWETLHPYQAPVRQSPFDGGDGHTTYLLAVLELAPGTRIDPGIIADELRHSGRGDTLWARQLSRYWFVTGTRRGEVRELVAVLAKLYQMSNVLQNIELLLPDGVSIAIRHPGAETGLVQAGVQFVDFAAGILERPVARRLFGLDDGTNTNYMPDWKALSRIQSPAPLTEKTTDKKKTPFNTTTEERKASIRALFLERLTIKEPRPSDASMSCLRCAPAPLYLLVFFLFLLANGSVLLNRCAIREAELVALPCECVTQCAPCHAMQIADEWLQAYCPRCCELVDGWNLVTD